MTAPKLLTNALKGRYVIEREIGTRQALFEDVYVTAPVHAQYDVSPDDAKFLFSKTIGGDPKAIVILNWLGEMRSRMRGVRSH